MRVRASDVPAACRRRTARGRSGSPRTRPTDTTFIERSALAPGAVLEGPLVVTQFDATTLVPPGSRLVGRSERQPADRGRPMSPAGARARSHHARDHLERAQVDQRQVLDHHPEERLLHQHQGAPRPLHGHRRRTGPADRPGRDVAADPPGLPAGADAHPGRALRRRHRRGRPLHRQRSARRRRHAPARHQHGDAGVRRWAAGRLRLQPRAPRRRRRRRARLHVGRHVGDLPGGPAHPGHAALSPRRARHRAVRPAAPQHAPAGRAPRRPQRPDRRLPAGRRAHAAAVRPLRHADWWRAPSTRSSTARPSACAPASPPYPTAATASRTCSTTTG